MNSSSSSPRHGRDPGVKLIRISPARIQTQVTQTVRYRPVRSLLLLGLLVVISLFVLFTLSQMAVVQHTMMAQLETGRPGGGGGGWAGVSQGGGRASRPAQKPWRSQFNQFKIEPLLIRNAPSVEVNSAMAANRRRASQIAAIILRSSLLANQYPNLTYTTIATHPKEDLIPTHQPPPQTAHTTHQTLVRHPPTQQNLNQTKKHKDVSSSSLPRETGLSEVTTHITSVPEAPSANREANSPVSRLKGNTWMDSDAVKSDKYNKTNNRRKTDREQNNNTNSDSSIVQSGNNISRTERKQVRKLRRQFFNRLECDSSPETECDNKNSVYRDKPSNAKNKVNEQKREKSGAVDHNNNEGSLNDNKLSDNSPQDKETLLKITSEPDDTGASSRLGEAIDKSSEPLPTEFSEAEKDFEPLYLREDEDYDIQDDSTSDPPTSEPQMTTKKVPTEEQLRKLPTCPEIPPGLQGHLNISLDDLERLRLNDVLKQLEWVMPGGTWSPSYESTNPCLPRHKVAVVLPYRDRLHHLIILLSWLHPILRRQQLEYTIYVAEQAGNATFNKGSIMNAGFMEAWQRSNANCFVFHDVDLLPEDDRNMYSCPPQPRHLSVGVDTLGYKLPYFLLVGGVLSVRGEHFLRLNGYSNMYWGWGGEDDDMGYRIKQSGLSITRPPNMLARYTMIRHLKRRPLTWKVRGKLVRTSGRRYRLDGLNTLKYSLLALHKHPLFTHLLLDVGTPPENLVRLDAH